MKKLLSLILILSLLSIGYYLWQRNKLDKNYLILFGNIDIRQVNISFKASGTLSEMMFEEGDTVKKGDLLATLDDRDYLLAYKQAQAETARLKAKMEEAISVLETNLPLCKQKISSERSCISYRNIKDEATAAYKAALLAEEAQKNQLDYTRIYSPADGIISLRIIEPGATITNGQPVYTITKTSPLWVRVYLPEPELGNIDYGSKAVIITDSIDPKTQKAKRYRGHVGYISPIAEFTPKTVQTTDLRTDLVYRLNIYIDENDGGLKQGMPVTVKLFKGISERFHDWENRH